MRALISASIAGLCMLSTAAYSQSASGAPPSSEALQAARDVVMRAQGDRNVTLKAMSAPTIGLIQQAGVKEPDRAQVLVQGSGEIHIRKAAEPEQEFCPPPGKLVGTGTGMCVLN